MNSLQVVASLDNPSAGPSYSVVQLAEELRSRGVFSSIMCTTKIPTTSNDGEPVRAFAWEGSSIPLFSGLHFSRALEREIDRSAGDDTILHSHGMWTLPNLYAARSARRHSTPHIISPRGMLAPPALTFSRRRKNLIWHLAQRNAVESATCLHATSAQEYNELRALGLRMPIAIIPNGINIPSAVRVELGKSRRSHTQRTLLYLGRIHPKKGLDNLIEAWARLEPAHPNWRLRVIGPLEGEYAQGLTRRVRELKSKRLFFDGPLFGLDKEEAYQQADLFVLPTLNENFGMVVAESLANSTPVICTRGAPWSDLTQTNSGWWIDHGVNPLHEALTYAMSQPRAVLDGMGEAGRHWMTTHFSWGRIAAEMEEVYLWMLGRAGKPAKLETAQ